MGKRDEGRGKKGYYVTVGFICDERRLVLSARFESLRDGKEMKRSDGASEIKR